MIYKYIYCVHQPHIIYNIKTQQPFQKNTEKRIIGDESLKITPQNHNRILSGRITQSINNIDEFMADKIINKSGANNQNPKYISVERFDFLKVIIIILIQFLILIIDYILSVQSNILFVVLSENMLNIVLCLLVFNLLFIFIIFFIILPRSTMLTLLWTSIVITLIFISLRNSDQWNKIENVVQNDNKIDLMVIQPFVINITFILYLIAFIIFCFIVLFPYLVEILLLFIILLFLFMFLIFIIYNSNPNSQIIQPFVNIELMRKYFLIPLGDLLKEFNGNS